MVTETPVVWMDRKQVAAHLGVSVRAVETWAQRGGGPPYFILHPRLIRYRLQDVDNWAQSEPRIHTADDGNAAAILREAEVLRAARNLVGRRKL